MTQHVVQAKAQVRAEVWQELEKRAAANGQVRGKIPDFVDAAGAAQRLAGLACWRAARRLLITPDLPMRPVLARALAEGKRVYLPVPGLRAVDAFRDLDPRNGEIDPVAADGVLTGAVDAESIGRGAQMTDLETVDLAVLGSVALDTKGGRLGKGRGYADIEMALLAHAGALTTQTIVASVAHDLQLRDTPLPVAGHDVSVGVIVTPSRVVWTDTTTEPIRVDWERLPPRMLAEIPALAQLRPRPTPPADS